MKTYCSQCGTVYEVSGAQKGSYMCCVTCDRFFKVREKTAGQNPNIPVQSEFPVGVERGDTGSGFIARVKKTCIGFFGRSFSGGGAAKTSGWKAHHITSPDTGEAAGKVQPRILIDDFLAPGTDFSEDDYGETNEYADFFGEASEAAATDDAGGL
ncbi:MAG: hypothetical protein PHV59_09160, partial [Victivallales bacterium]|nr:hypothetical protein [Victivallales bacterium]